jgi:hypothetical protein
MATADDIRGGAKQQAVSVGQVRRAVVAEKR